MNAHFQFTYLGQTNHRRAGSAGANFIDWLIANPASKAKSIKDAGHDLKHLRWDLKHSPKMFSVVDGLTGKPTWITGQDVPAEDAPAEDAPTEDVPTTEEVKPSVEDLLSEIVNEAEDIKSDLETLRDEEQEYYDNMPESFQNGERGENAQTEIDEMETAIDSLEEVTDLTAE